MVVINMGEPRKWPWLEQKAAYSSQHWPTLTLTKKQLPLSKNMTLLLCLEKGKKKKSLYYCFNALNCKYIKEGKHRIQVGYQKD